MQMPMGWRWLNRISPATWIIYGLAIDQLGENTDMMTAPDGRQTTVKQFMKDYFGYDYSFRWLVTSQLFACHQLTSICHRSYWHLAHWLYLNTLNVAYMPGK